MALALTILTFAYLLFAVTPTTLGLYCSAILFGMSFLSIPTISVVAAAEYVGTELRSAAAGFVTFFFGVGQVVGPALSGYAIETTQVFGYSFLMASIGSIIGCCGALALKKPKI